MKDKTKQNLILPIVSVSILAFLMFALINISSVIKTIKSFYKNEIQITEIKSEIEQNYREQLIGKNFFINLNGLYCKLTGQREVNGVVLSSDRKLLLSGIKEKKFNDKFIKKVGESVVDFSNFLASLDVEFYYTIMPFKIDLKNEVVPRGLIDYHNTDVDNLFKYINEGNVKVLDLRQSLSRNINDIEKNFYNTDHHWNADGSFAGYQLILDYLSSNSKFDFQFKYSDKSNWKKEVLKDWFLGSYGKRVGVYFAGVDDFTYHIPNFNTEMSIVLENKNIVKKGSYSEVILDKKHITEKDYFGLNPYAVNTGGSFTVVRHRNQDAINDIKILIIKDSFVLPIQSLMSTEFKEIDVIDPRRYSESSIKEYVAWYKPDIVFFMANPSTMFSDNYINFGDDLVLLSSENQSTYDSILIPSEAKNYNYATIPTELSNDCLYRLSFESISVLKGNPEGLTIGLLSNDDKKVDHSTVFEIDNMRKEDYQWFIKIPNDGKQYTMIVYAGIRGKTSENEIMLSNISVEKIDVK